VGALTTVPEARIGALDEEWSNSISSNATNVSQNTETAVIHYPVIGDAYPGSFYGGLHQDTSFCSPRTYTNARCVEGTGHSGQDLEEWSGAASGEISVVAAYGGTVDKASCAPGAGYRVNIEGDDGRYYRYFHLYPGSIAVGVGQTVKAGQLVGKMGQTKVCSGSDTGTSLHLHFDRFDGPEECPVSTCARDSWRSLRSAFARPGLQSDGSTQNAAMNARYLTAIASFGDKEVGLLFAGYPVRGSGLWGANAVSLTSNPGSAGRKQWLGTGANTFDAQYRAGAITKRNSDSAAYWIRWGFWKHWKTLGEHSSYLGWPITDEYASASPFQWFEGGCIFQSGSTYADYPWGSGPCQLL
jgi:hypothetical protein